MHDESRRPDDAPATGAAPDGSEPRRRTYVPPELVEYGTVSKLTQAGNGSFNDAAGMMMMMACL
jgi:hypothetical protein